MAFEVLSSFCFLPTIVNAIALPGVLFAFSESLPTFIYSGGGASNFSLQRFQIVRLIYSIAASLRRQSRSPSVFLVSKYFSESR
jgi:hypothetical protein